MGTPGKNISDDFNHRRFTLRCPHQDLICVDSRPKLNIKTRKARKITHKADKNLLRECLRTIINIMELSVLRRDKCKEGLVADQVNCYGLILGYFINNYQSNLLQYQYLGYKLEFLMII